MIFRVRINLYFPVFKCEQLPKQYIQTVYTCVKRSVSLKGLNVGALESTQEF